MNSPESLGAQESIMERLKRVDPKRHPLFAAFDHLESSTEIARFAGEYAQRLADNSDDPDVIANPFKYAAADIGYCLMYIGPDTSRTWLNAIEGLSHPVFGRSALITP